MIREFITSTVIAASTVAPNLGSVNSQALTEINCGMSTANEAPNGASLNQILDIGFDYLRLKSLADIKPSTEDKTGFK